MEENKLSLHTEKINKLKTSLDNLKNKKSKFLFCVPDSIRPCASVYELYFHAKTLSNLGYEVICMTETNDYVVPTWIEDELTDGLRHECLSDGKINVAVEDFLIIPEIYTNIMEATRELPCKRIVFLQSFHHAVKSLIPGVNYKYFGINDIITTSDTLKKHIESFFGENKFNIKKYNVVIPDYFYNDDKLKKLNFSIVCRNEDDYMKFVKLFYLKYPQYTFINFDIMMSDSNPPQTLSRKDFAERLKENFAAIWIDRISSFGTFPLECMKSGTIPISLLPDIIPDYIINEDGTYIDKYCGMWTNSFYELPDIAANILIKYIDDTIDEKYYSEMNDITKSYVKEDSEIEVSNIYNSFIEERIELIEQGFKELNK